MTETARGKQYSTNVLMSALGISRGTLRYYEQLGIVNPQRDPESNYRTYSNADVFRVVESVMLKNAGYQVQRAKETLVDSPVDALPFVDDCLERSAFQLMHAQAVHERFALLRDVVEHPSTAPKLVMADEWLVYYDGCEAGYDQFSPNEAQDSLLEGMPVSSFAAVMDTDVCTHEPYVQTRWGRSIPSRYRKLMPALDAIAAEPVRLCGCPCVTMHYSDDEDKVPGFDKTGEVRTAMAAFLASHGLRQAGPVVAPCVLPARGRLYTRLFLPVEAANIRGRMAIAALGK